MPEAPRPRAARRPPPRRRSMLQGLPLTIRYGVPLGLLVLLAVTWWQSWRAGLTTVAVVGPGGAAVEGATLEFFVFDDARSARSPSARLGESAVAAGGRVTVGRDLVPGQALVRVRAPGLGVGFAYVEPGEQAQLCDLGPPARLEGTVLGPGGAAAEGALVQAFGGGSHGVLLAEATVDEAGRFEVGGFSSTVAYLHLRVFQPGMAVAAQDAWVGADQEIAIALVPTEPVAGRVVTPEGMSAAALWVQADSVPGVGAETDAEGRFELDHLPPAPTVTRLLVGPLPATHTHRLTLVTPGTRDVEIRVCRAGEVSGRVVDRSTGVGIAGASVIHDHGSRGRVAVRCDEGGNFTIGQLPPGEVILEALVPQPRSDVEGARGLTMRTVRRTLQLDEAEVRTGVAITLQ